MSSQYVINSPLFLNSLENGVIVPRLTTSQKTAIVGPIAGTCVYDTSLNDFQFFNGTNWISSGYGATGGTFVNSLTDGFGRLRVSNPFTLFDSKFRYEDNGKFDTTITGVGATGYINSTASTYEMTVSTASSQIIRQSYQISPYQPGKSLLVLCSFVGAAGSYTATGLTQKVGYVSDLNGIYTSVIDGVVYMNILNNGSNTAVAQSEWNVDKLNGTGPSGITLDITKCQIFWTDIEWLGVGTVNVGFVINGQFITVHEFQHANLLTATYMTTASLPIRYEIQTSAGYSSGSQVLQQICSTVMSEGGYQQRAEKNFYTSGTTTKSVPTSLTPLVSLRLRSDRIDSIILPAEVSMIITSNGVSQYQLIFNGTLTGGTWVNAASNSVCQFNTGASAISGGQIIDVNYVTSSNQGKVSLTVSDNFNQQIGRTITGASQIITLAAQSFSSAQDVAFSLGWLELT
jgi:hypothetical protein